MSTTQRTRSPEAAQRDAQGRLPDGPLAKSPTGIPGFDEVTGGGLPAGRLSAIIGGPGAGKTVFAVQTLVNRFRSTGEPGIFVAFEEPVSSILSNMAGFDWDLAGAIGTGLWFVDAELPAGSMLGGAFDLSGLLAVLSGLIEDHGARTVVFDGLEMLLSTLQDVRLARQELARLNDWVRQSSVSALMTVKSPGGESAWDGGTDDPQSDFLQYMTDCVVTLDRAWTPTASSRRLRVVKYRGSGFTTNPVPVVIGRSGLEVVSFRSTRPSYTTSTERVSSGIARLDALLGGGYVRGSSTLVSGSPGTAKTSLGASFIAAACARGETALFISFDESPSQIIANMLSIGRDLQPYIDAELLAMASLLSSGRSPEEHLLAIRGLMRTHAPRCIVIDPLSSLLKADYPFTDMISERIIDEAKSRGITLLCTSLLDHVSGDQEFSASNVSTIADTWMHVSYVAQDGERNRALTIIKSRGSSHSNQVRELVLSSAGIDLEEVYLAEGQVLMGSARRQKEAAEQEAAVRDMLSYQRARMQLDQDIAALRAQADAAGRELLWKQQQLALLETAEADRTHRQQAAAAARRGGRLGIEGVSS
jgi:circadian clock protein KaiC